MRTRYADIPAYLTKDGSTIRELMHPSVHGNRQQSLAEATVEPGARTQLHRHALTEELPDQQTTAALELAHITTGISLPPYAIADYRWITELRAAVLRQYRNGADARRRY